MTARLPLFPLGSVLFPGMVLPLYVFEERYRRLVADLSALPEDEPRRFGVVAIRNGSEVAPAVPGPAPAGADPTGGLGADPVRALYHVGCVAEVAAIRTAADGHSEVISSGSVRFRLLSVDTTGPYLVGEVKYLSEESGQGTEELASSVGLAYTEYRKRVAGGRGGTPAGTQGLPDDPTALSYAVAATVVADTTVKQRLLEAKDTAARLEEELALLRRETAVIGRLPSLPATELTRRVPHPN